MLADFQVYSQILSIFKKLAGNLCQLPVISCQLDFMYIWNITVHILFNDTCFVFSHNISKVGKTLSWILKRWNTSCTCVNLCYFYIYIVFISWPFIYCSFLDLQGAFPDILHLHPSWGSCPSLGHAGPIYVTDSFLHFGLLEGRVYKMFIFALQCLT